MSTLVHMQKYTVILYNHILQYDTSRPHVVCHITNGDFLIYIKKIPQSFNELPDVYCVPHRLCMFRRRQLCLVSFINEQNIVNCLGLYMAQVSYIQ